MGAGRILLNVLVVLAAIVGGFYQLKLKPLLVRWGHGRVVESIGNGNCKVAVPELKACEKVVLHQPSGVIYLACSTPESRTHWLPNSLHLDAAKASRTDYVASYDPKSGKVVKLKTTNFDSPRGLSLHGMDVVPSATNPNELYVYLVNHRAPLTGDAHAVGADSSVEVFTTTLGSSTMNYVRTVESPLIATPNDVTGTPDGASFWVTNDHGAKTGFTRQLDKLGRASTSVVYCNESEGCKYAVQGMHGNNGITQAANGTFYVVNSIGGQLSILEKQADNTLVITDVISNDRSMDNVMVDSKGHVWVAGFPNVLRLVKEHFKDPTVLAPANAFRFTINTGPGAFYGEKFKVEKVFEDNGNIASGITSAVYDADRNRLFLHGIAADKLVICEL